MMTVSYADGAEAVPTNGRSPLRDRHYATGLESTVEIESFWTAARRGGLPDRFRVRAEAVSHISSRYGAPNSKPVGEG